MFVSKKIPNNAGMLRSLVVPFVSSTTRTASTVNLRGITVSYGIFYGAEQTSKYHHTKVSHSLGDLALLAVLGIAVAVFVESRNDICSCALNVTSHIQHHDCKLW